MKNNQFTIDNFTWSFIIMFGSIFLLLNLNFEKYSSAENSYKELKIMKFAGKAIKECGENQYLTYINIEDNLVFEKIASVSDIITYECNSINECNIDSKRYSSDCVGSKIIIDDYSYSFFKENLKNGPVYYSDLSKLQNLPIASSLIHCSKKNIVSSAAAIVTKINKITHAFILSNTDKKNKNCNKEKAIKILEKIAKFTDNTYD
jgi:hypothetical protein